MAKSNLPKLDIPYNQDVRLKLTKDRPYTSSNGRGPYFLYTLLDLKSNEAKALFADVSVHDAIESKKLGAGSEIIIRKTPMSEAGKIMPRFEVQIVNAVERKENGHHGKPDNFKQILLQCILDASDVVKQSGLQFSMEETEKLAVALLIARTKTY